MLPVLGKLNELAGSWSIKVALRDENPELMEKFLTNGTRAIPIFLFLDEKSNLLFTWGPRIKTAQEIFESYREAINSGEIGKPEVMKKVRAFYAKNRGQSIFCHGCSELPYSLLYLLSFCLLLLYLSLQVRFSLSLFSHESIPQNQKHICPWC